MYVNYLMRDVTPWRAVLQMFVCEPESTTAAVAESSGSERKRSEQRENERLTPDDEN